MLPSLRKRRGALYRWSLLALAETAVTTPWLIFLYSMSGTSGWVDALPGAWLLVTTYLAAALWEAGAPQDGRAGSHRVWAMAAGMAGVYAFAYLVLPPGLAQSPLAPNLAMWTLPVAGYLWYLGAGSITQGIEYGRYYERFTVQALTMVAAVILLVSTGTAREPRIQVMLYWSILLLFGSGLTLLVVTRDRSLRADQTRLGDAAHSSDALSPVVTWVVGLLGAVTILASRIISPEQLAAVAGAAVRLLDVPFTWLGKAIGLILIPVIMLVFAVIHFVAGFLKPAVRQAKPDAPQMVGQQPFPEELLRQGGALDLMPYLKIAALLAVLAALAVLVHRLRRKRELDVDGGDEERINLGLWSGLMADLKALLQRPAPPATAAAATAEPLKDPHDPRALFRRLQAWGAAMGRPRLPRETPHKYGEALAAQQPAGTAACVTVCAVYDEARYAAAAPSPEAVDAALLALDALTHPTDPRQPQ